MVAGSEERPALDLTLTNPSPHRIDSMKTEKDIDDAIDALPPERLREFVRTTVKALFITTEPVFNDDTGEEEDIGPRLLLDGEDFPSGADFIDFFCDVLPRSVASACSPD